MQQKINKMKESSLHLYMLPRLLLEPFIYDSIRSTSHLCFTFCLSSTHPSHLPVPSPPSNHHHRSLSHFLCPSTIQQSRPGRRRSRRTIMIATCAHFICDSSRREYSVREEVSQQGADRRLHGVKKGKKLGSLSMPIKLWYTIYKWGPWMNESGGIDGRLTKSHKFSPWRTLLHINV